MAINVSFNGATIFKPGAYSKTTIDLGGGFPLGPTGLIGIFGEANRGAPRGDGDVKDNVFSPEQLPEIREKYGSGSLVDAATFAFSPAADAEIPSGAQAVWIYKTNESTRSTHSMLVSYADLISLEYGEGANRITIKVTGIDEVPASAGPGVAFDETTIGSGDKFSLAQDGAVANVFTFSGAPTSNADLNTQLQNGANWSAGLPAVFTISVSGSDGASIVAMSQDVKVNQHRDGFGRSFELVEGTGSPLAIIGLSAQQYTPSLEASRTVTLSQKRDLLDEEDTIGGNIALSAGFDSAGDDASAADVTVDATNVTISVTGGAEAGSKAFKKSDFATLTELAAAIALETGWSVAADALSGQLSPDVLDEVASVGALSEQGESPARIKKDASEFNDLLGLSTLVAIDGAEPDTGLPDIEGEKFFSGAVLGATSTSAITDALDAFTKVRLNSIVPLFSRDATADISDGLTDVGSAYTIVGIHQAVKTHLSLMATTKRRSERQGYLSFKDTFDNSKIRAQEIADARSQLVIQDIRQIQADGSLVFFLPWALAVMLAGARGGAPVGTPLTNKNFNVAGIRHTSQPLSTAEEDIILDFDPDTQFDEAIQNGLTFLEAPQTGGFRLVVDNTTYGRDANFVFNRGNVLYAADVLVFDLRNQLESIYVGKKNIINAVEVKSTVESIMDQFLSQGITVQSDDAPNGFKDLVVRIEGNTIFVNLVAKLVEGIDFVLIDLTIQRKTSSA